MASHIPSTPRVISPSPTPSDASAKGDYFAPVTRSAARRSRVSTPAPISEDGSADERRARARSRSPGLSAKQRAKNARRRNIERSTTFGVGAGGITNGHLAPPETKSSTREVSRSPSPLGLIPIHMDFRSFIHRHEVPRKILHVSIGFLTTYLYTAGATTDQIHPVLLALLIPIASVDVLRHRLPSFNRFYVKVLGALMRESEVEGYNGVIWYLLGAWAVMRFCPKDIGVMSIILLSWCDTAASTFGRQFGRYTPKIRQGKSLAGSLAAMVVGVLTAAWFWGYLAPRYEGVQQRNGPDFAFQGRLSLPSQAKELVGLKSSEGVATGPLALAIMSIVTGFIASVSEAIDVLGWDDNLTIPLLSSLGLWSFLKAFGSA